MLVFCLFLKLFCLVIIYPELVKPVYRAEQFSKLPSRKHSFRDIQGIFCLIVVAQLRTLEVRSNRARYNKPARLLIVIKLLTYDNAIPANRS